MKENSDINDIIVSASVPQHAYYSERTIYNFNVGGLINTYENESAFDERIKQVKPRFFIISVFEPGFTPKWAYDWAQRHNDTAIPVKAYFADYTQKQPLLIIYEMNYK